MAKSSGQGMEAIAVKRSSLADADKVRYRVYRAPDDFIAVIAESALMAMKTAGIEKPYRIVRDLPTEGIAIEAKKMSKVEEPRVTLPITMSENRTRFITADIVDKVVPADGGFVPMHLRDLQRKPVSWARVLTPDMVQQIMAPPKPAPAPPAPEPVILAPEPVFEAESETIYESELLPEPVAAAPEPAPAPATSATAEGELTPEEVEKLLNG